MKERIENYNPVSQKLKLIGVLLFVYILLFEFTLPVNKILPKPSLLAESFIHIWTDYSLLLAIGVTSTVVYISMLVAYGIIFLFSGIISKILSGYAPIFEALKIFKYFPAFFFAVLFVYWFDDAWLAEFGFGIAASFFSVASALKYELERADLNYVNMAKNIGLGSKRIYADILFKSVEPRVFEKLKSTHYYLWIIILIYEFIGASSGLGGVYKAALDYNDFTALFSFAIIISLLILFGSYAISFIKEKLFFWDK